MDPPTIRALSLPSARLIQASRWLSRVARNATERPSGLQTGRSASWSSLGDGAEGAGAELLHPDLAAALATPRHGDLAAVGRKGGGGEAPLEGGIHRQLTSAAVHPDDADAAALSGLIDQRAVLGDRELHRRIGDLVLNPLEHQGGRVGQPALPRLVAGDQDAAVRRADGDEPRRQIPGV
jgi:hypothetical protein